MEEIFEPIPTGIITKDELFNFLEDFPALLWRIDIIKNKIEYLNSYKIKGLGAKSGLILQNIDFRNRIILKEDLHLLERFMESVRNGETAATIFRIKNKDDHITWIKVTGTIDRKNPRFYLGYMLDVSDTVGIVQDTLEKDADIEAMIELVNNPVVLIDPYDKTIIAHNMAARDLFGYQADKFSKLKFSDLYHHSIEIHINRIYEETVFERKWEGKLTFQRKNNSPFIGNVVIRSLFFRGVRVFRVSMDNVSVDDEVVRRFVLTPGNEASSSDPADKDYINKLMKMLRNKSDISAILQIMLDNQHGHMNFDSIIYSDIYIRKNKVVVYSAGKALSPMKQGEVFSYEGTIAENLNRYKLDYLIMEDTFSSIKAIDWALFIPHGLRSYFAKPFFERKVMRTVLILCSTQHNMFSDKYISDYALLYKPFLKGLTIWRKAKKKKTP